MQSGITYSLYFNYAESILLTDSRGEHIIWHDYKLEKNYYDQINGHYKLWFSARTIIDSFIWKNFTHKAWIRPYYAFQGNMSHARIIWHILQR